MGGGEGIQRKTLRILKYLLALFGKEHLYQTCHQAVQERVRLIIGVSGRTKTWCSFLFERTPAVTCQVLLVWSEGRYLAFSKKHGQTGKASRNSYIHLHRTALGLKRSVSRAFSWGVLSRSCTSSSGQVQCCGKGALSNPRLAEAPATKARAASRGRTLSGAGKGAGSEAESTLRQASGPGGEDSAAGEGLLRAEQRRTREGSSEAELGRAKRSAQARLGREASRGRRLPPCRPTGWRPLPRRPSQSLPWLHRRRRHFARDLRPPVAGWKVSVAFHSRRGSPLRPCVVVFKSCCACAAAPGCLAKRSARKRSQTSVPLGPSSLYGSGGGTISRRCALAGSEPRIISRFLASALLLNRVGHEEAQWARSMLGSRLAVYFLPCWQKYIHIHTCMHTIHAYIPVVLYCFFFWQLH